ncbi:GNAT family N-acetyltransferase [Paracoccus cavernae]|uniref:GNAT family N-acetyltransferase n=1 Tax=Paracoccus cavernae TaxID=1571207 RepID=UPI0035F234FE
MILWREAVVADVPAVVALLRDDVLGQGRELADAARYEAAFRAMEAEGANHLVVGESAGQVVACYQITFITGLSLSASRRAQIESLRVSSELRGQGIGAVMIADAEARARAAGCSLMQFTSNQSRSAAHRFYERLGFTPSHIGYKKTL